MAHPTGVAPPVIPSSQVRHFAVRHPVTAFLIVALPVAWINMLIPLIAGWGIGSLTLVGALLVGLVGGSVVITGWTGGRPAVRALFAGVARWQMGFVNAVVVVLALPVLTVVVAAGTGDLETPSHGWVVLLASVMTITLLNTLVVNLWEELGWTGFVQSRLMSRHGLLRGSLMTAPAFFAIHWPLVFQEHGVRGTTARDALIYFTVLGLLAPVFRYLIGMVFVSSGGSILAVGLMHGSFNAAGSMDVVPNAWQHVPAVLLLTILVWAFRRRRRRTVGS